MGRQRDRARRRREQQRQERPERTAQQTGRQTGRTAAPQKGGQRTWLLAASAVVVAAIVAVAIAFAVSRHSTSAGSIPTTKPAASPPFESGQKIDGIPCTAEMLTYHVHAHLTILDAGKQIIIPANTGISYAHECLYWLHTHDNSGIIHVEAPHKVNLHLGNFFDIWGQPLSRTQVSTARVKAGQRMVVWVNGHTYSGDPRSIPLGNHTSITVEIGPPFRTPKPYNFNGL